MKQIARFGTLLLLAALLTGSVLAVDFTNGGFETGDLSGWTCDDCTLGSTDPYSGSYYASRAADGTLSQTVTLECETYHLLWAARQISAGEFDVDAGFSTCGADSSTYTPALPGQTWSLHYRNIEPCEGDTDFTVSFGGTGAGDIDAVGIVCLESMTGSSGDTGAVTVGTLSDGSPVNIYPTYTFGDLALFAISFVIAIILFIQLVMRLMGVLRA